MRIDRGMGGEEGGEREAKSRENLYYLHELLKEVISGNNSIYFEFLFAGQVFFCSFSNSNGI